MHRRFLAGMAVLMAGPVMSAMGAMVIVESKDATYPERLAAREVRRYLYVRSGELVPISRADEASKDADLIIVARKDRDVIYQYAPDGRMAFSISRLAPQEYLVKRMGQDGRRTLVIVGGDEIGTLYGAYRFAEHLGVRFYMEGDVVPDERIPLAIPDITDTGRPLFELRGIQPFHDFPEGPDWWDLDAYQAIISQLPKLRMNFLGLHTYPEGGVGPEPLTWIGPPEDVGEDGRVKASYPSRHFSTVSGTWGYQPKKTSEYLYGASMLFADDNHCQDVQAGMAPWPATPEQCNELFNRFGGKLKAAFEHARRLGVKTCIGTEVPLIVPSEVRQRLKPGEPGIEVVGGSFADYGSAIEGTEDDALYRSVRWNMAAYRFVVPDG
ncbi:MAG: hypothetical protein HY718_06400, partial [Planctomycetes bacterium]|nr:hypothetical protein [Planctomycetota bacterium]